MLKDLRIIETVEQLLKDWTMVLSMQKCKTVVDLTTFGYICNVKKFGARQGWSILYIFMQW
jgi:hypothetical protein